jgi:hypothetical protein
VTATGERREAVGAARRRSGRHDFGPRLGRDGGATGEVGCREVGGASEAVERGATLSGGGRRGRLTAALSRGVGAVRGSHTAMARCRTGPARRTESDRWGPLVSDFRIKNHPERK